jgi:hypothetical protein
LSGASPSRSASTREEVAVETSRLKMLLVAADVDRSAVVRDSPFHLIVQC